MIRVHARTLTMCFAGGWSTRGDKVWFIAVGNDLLGLTIQVGYLS